MTHRCSHHYGSFYRAKETVRFGSQTYAVNSEDKRIRAGIAHGQEMAGEEDDIDESESAEKMENRRLVGVWLRCSRRTVRQIRLPIVTGHKDCTTVSQDALNGSRKTLCVDH